MRPRDSELLSHHLTFLEQISTLTPIPFVMGGYAEDALMGEEVTRPHQDVDLVFPRSEIELRLRQLRSLGFETFDTWGENRSGEPFYLAASDGNLQIDVGICDEDGGDAFIEVGRVFFQVDGRPAPVGYRLHFPEDTLPGTHCPHRLETLCTRITRSTTSNSR